MFTNKAQLDGLRSLAFGSIGSSYTAVGSPTAYPARIICFTNTTNEDVLVSMNPTVEDQLIVPAGSFKLFDITTNHRPINQDDFCFPSNTQWYVKYTASPGSGAFYIEIIYAEPS